MSFQRRTAALLIIAVMAAACVLPVTARDDQMKAEVFVEIAEKAREITLGFIEKAALAGNDVSVSVNLLEEGSRLLTQAKTAYDEADYESAAADARLAQEKFRDALKALGSENNSSEEDEEDAKPRLLEAIERARERIRKVREVLSSSNDISENLREQINAKLIQAEGLLNEAESIVGTNVKNASEAAQKLGQAEKLVSEAFVMLKHASHEPNRHRIEAFLRNMERDISRLRSELEKLVKKGNNVEDLNSSLSQAENLVGSAREKSAKDDLAGALTDIQQAKEIIQQVRKEIAGHHKP